MYKTIINRIEAISRTIFFGLCLTFSAGVGVADYLTGDLTLLVFYFIPIACATWFAGKTAGLIISGICSAELITINALAKCPAPPFIRAESGIRSCSLPFFF